jgi:hypothetical protein
VIVSKPVLQQELRRHRRHLPPWRHIAARLLAGEFFDQFDRLLQYVLFLPPRHRHRILMRIAVRADLVPRGDNHPGLLGEGLDRMAGNEPARLELELVEQFQEPGYAHLAGEHPALDVRGRILAAIGAEPTRDRIDVHAKATKDLFRHSLSPSGSRRPRLYHVTRSASGHDNWHECRLEQLPDRNAGPPSAQRAILIFVDEPYKRGGRLRGRASVPRTSHGDGF